MLKRMSEELVIYRSSEPKIKWTPEDFGFLIAKIGESPVPLWYFKNFELRSFPNDYWLCRRKVKNDKGNTEMLHRWWVKIRPDDVEFAKMLFTKGLE
jgi:hypothetical protein